MLSLTQSVARSCLTARCRVGQHTIAPLMSSSTFVPKCRIHVSSPTVDGTRIASPSQVFHDKLPDSSGVCATYIQKRFYNRKKTVKILPTKVLNFDYGGDLTTVDYPIEESEFRTEFDGMENLNEVEETMKKLLSVEFGDGRDKMRRRITNILEKVKEHPLDVRSREVIIAYQTVAIRNQMKHVDRMRKDRKAKSLLIMRLQARRKHLRRLRNQDFDKYQWLCDELQVKYIPVSEYAFKPLSRRAKLKAEARKAAIETRKNKMELFKKQLEEEKKEFVEYKEKELVDIEQEMRTLGIEDSSPMWRVYEALKQGDLSLLELKPKPVKSRRQLILEKKFELAALRAKEREKQQ